MKKHALILLICILLSSCSQKMFCFNNEDITNIYASYVEDWKKESELSFDKAEVKVFSLPKPDIIGPNPDPKLCICKGTGVIVQGDGHKTICEYHGGKILQQKERVIK